MSERGGWRLLDVAAIAVFGVGLALIAVLPLPDWAKALAFVPVVLILPGYGASRFLPEGVGRAEAIIYIVSISIAVTVLGGLVVQSFISLDRTTWAVLLISIAAVSIGLGVTRPRTAAAPAERPAERPVRRRVGVVAVAGLIAGTAIAGGAIAIATEGAHDQADRTRFGSLWAVPTTEAQPSGGGAWTVGVENHGDRASGYVLRVTRGPELVREWKLRLAADQNWSTNLASSVAAGGGPLIASLYRDGRLYRRVTLEIGGIA